MQSSSITREHESREPQAQRPWGQAEVLSKREGLCVRRLVVNPGARISLQRHRRRREHWFIVDGIADVDIGGEMSCLCSGQSVDIASGSWHRLTNVGFGPLVVMEIQTGDAFDEEDIERGADDCELSGVAASFEVCE